MRGRSITGCSPTCSFFILSRGCWRHCWCGFRLGFSAAFIHATKGDPGIQNMKQGDFCEKGNTADWTWKDTVSINFWKSSTSKTFITYFNRKSWREFQGNKVSQTCKVGTGSCHEVNNRGHLLHQGEGMILTHPQGTFKPSWHQQWLINKTTNKLYVDINQAPIMLCEPSSLIIKVIILTIVSSGSMWKIVFLDSYFCVRTLISMGRPMSLFPRSKSGSKYSSGVMAVGLVAVAYSIVMSYNSMPNKLADWNTFNLDKWIHILPLVRLCAAPRYQAETLKCFFHLNTRKWTFQ